MFIDKYVMIYAYVPEHFLSCKELSYMDKLVYIRIVGFCRNEEYNHTCFASNGYFANLFGVKPKAISVTIGKLKRLDYININYVKNDNNYCERDITLTSNVWCEISNNDSLTEEELQDIIYHKLKDKDRFVIRSLYGIDTRKITQKELANKLSCTQGCIAKNHNIILNLIRKSLEY